MHLPNATQRSKRGALRTASELLLSIGCPDGRASEHAPALCELLLLRIALLPPPLQRRGTSVIPPVLPFVQRDSDLTQLLDIMTGKQGRKRWQKCWHVPMSVQGKTREASDG